MWASAGSCLVRAPHSTLGRDKVSASPSTPSVSVWTGNHREQPPGALFPQSVGDHRAVTKTTTWQGSLQSRSSRVEPQPCSEAPEPRGRLRGHLLLTQPPWTWWHLLGLSFLLLGEFLLGSLVSESVLPRHPPACHPPIRSIRARPSLTQECSQPPAADRRVGRKMFLLEGPRHNSS